MAEGQLHGKVAIVTGAGSRIGLGRAMTLALVRAGARVAMVDVDGETLEQSAGDARELGGSDCVLTIVGDVTNPADAERAVERTIRGFGGLHVLVNNAGINPRNPVGPAFWDLSPETWTKTILVNTCGPFYMARAAIAPMRTQHWGRIIGVTTSLDTMLRGAPYGPSKAGHEALVAVMAQNLDGTGVTANVLVPGGAADTNMIPLDQDRSGLLKPTVMQAPVVWLASGASDGYSGHRIIAQHWDESVPLAERLERVGAPAGWPQLGRQTASEQAPAR